MDPLVAIALIDKVISVVTLVTNAFGSSKLVSDIIAKRLAEGGRDWTPEERQAVLDDLSANKAYAAKQLGLDLPQDISPTPSAP